MPYKDPEKQKEARRRYRETHPDRVKASKIRYATDHPEAHRAERSRHNKSNYTRHADAFAARYAAMEPARRQAMLVRQQERLTERRLFLNQYRAERGCAVCGELHPACLDFHHRDPTQKILNLKQMKSYSMERIRAEVEKCDVLCANCHRKLHAAERE